MQNLTYTGYLQQMTKKDMQVLITVQKDILNTVIIENQTNSVSYLYYIILNIRKHNMISGKYSKKIRIVNLYDNKNGNRCIWQRWSSII